MAAVIKHGIKNYLVKYNITNSRIGIIDSHNRTVPSARISWLDRKTSGTCKSFTKSAECPSNNKYLRNHKNFHCYCEDYSYKRIIAIAVKGDKAAQVKTGQVTVAYGRKYQNLKKGIPFKCHITCY